MPSSGWNLVKLQDHLGSDLASQINAIPYCPRRGEDTPVKANLISWYRWAWCQVLPTKIFGYIETNQIVDFLAIEGAEGNSALCLDRSNPPHEVWGG